MQVVLEIRQHNYDSVGGKKTHETHPYSLKIIFYYYLLLFCKLIGSWSNPSWNSTMNRKITHYTVKTRLNVEKNTKTKKHGSFIISNQLYFFSNAFDTVVFSLAHC